jgi:hypothetical protein
MGKLFFSSIGAVVGTFVVAACVGEAPTAPTSGTQTQGGLDGPCFANGTCNEGLSCGVVKGTATCVPSGDASTVDASSIDDANAPDAADSGRPACKFQTTSFPCGDPMPPIACFGATQSCTLTGCGGTDLAWQCFSPRQCSARCCVPTANATLIAGADCAVGSLEVSPTATAGASCSSTAACAVGDTQLCQANSDCLAGQRCTPVKIVGGGAAINGNVVAVCVP